MLISLLVTVIVIGLLYYCVTLLPLPEPFKRIAVVIFILIAIIWLLGFVGVWGPQPYWGYGPHGRLP
jgi:hypothetical protein